MHAHHIVTMCGILAAGFACQWIAWRVKLPAILFLLLTGIALGPLTGVLDPDALLGDLLIPFVSIAVAIILFEGSMTLKFAELRGHGAVVRNLVTVGVLITWFASGLAAYLILDWDPYLAALFGAIVTVSGPTVVMPLIRAVRPAPSVSSILRWEAILVDPLGAILGLLVFEFIVATQASAGLIQALQTFGIVMIAGSLLGAVGGYLFGIAMRARVIPDFLRDYAALAAALTVFATAELIGSESGLLAITVMGVWLANMRGVDLEDVLSFKESLTILLVAALFILLAARLNVDELRAIGVGAVGILAVLQLVAGPLRALICAAGSPLNFREKLFLGWVFPRGIVAAAISALFALRLEQHGYVGADSLVPLVFTVILGTVIIQSLSARFVARWLDVAEPEPNGVLLIGSNRAALAVAKAMQDNGVKVLVADSHWASIRDARMLGLPTFYGSAVSSYAEEKLELTGLGSLLALSRRPGLNELACVRFADDFGRDHVFTLGNIEEGGHEKHKVSGESAGRILFDGAHSLAEILQRISQGDTLKTTTLSDAFDYVDYQQQHQSSFPIFAIDDNRKIHFPVGDKEFEPTAGWTVASLVTPDGTA